MAESEIGVLRDICVLHLLMMKQQCVRSLISNSSDRNWGGIVSRPNPCSTCFT